MDLGHGPELAKQQHQAYLRDAEAYRLMKRGQAADGATRGRRAADPLPVRMGRVFRLLLASIVHRHHH